jgi:ribosomal protein L37AE/L43A
METKMFESRGDEAVARPTMCPFCKGKRVDTLAKVITATTFWRCRECDKTWTIAGRAASSPAPR